MINNYSILKYFLLLFILLLPSCAAISIREKDIESMDIVFKAHGSYRQNVLVPGETYSVEVRVYEHGKRRPIKHPDFSEFRVVTSGHLDIVSQKNYKLQVRPSYPSGEWLFDSEYAIWLTIPENTFGGAMRVYKTDWDSFNRLDYSGSNGINGATGSSGYNSGRRIGGRGGNGGYGSNGQDVSLQACFLYGTQQLPMPDGSDRMVLLYQPSLDRTYLMSANAITIDLSGGNGGDGGNGGTGAHGEVYSRHETLDGGPGGNGGDGGDGGDGGRLSLTLPTGQTDFAGIFRINVTGGRGGDGGDGGYGGEPARRVEKNSEGKVIREVKGRRGPQGHSGRAGRAGRMGSYDIYRTPIESMFIGSSFIAAHPEVRELMTK